MAAKKKQEKKLGEAVNPFHIEKDLGVFISCDLKPSQHVAKVAARANKIIGLVKKNFDLAGKTSFVKKITEMASDALHVSKVEDNKLR